MSETSGKFQLGIHHRPDGGQDLLVAASKAAIGQAISSAVLARAQKKDPDNPTFSIIALGDNKAVMRIHSRNIAAIKHVAIQKTLLGDVNDAVGKIMEQAIGERRTIEPDDNFIPIAYSRQRIPGNVRFLFGAYVALPAVPDDDLAAAVKASLWSLATDFRFYKKMAADRAASQIKVDIDLAADKVELSLGSASSVQTRPSVHPEYLHFVGSRIMTGVEPLAYLTALTTISLAARPLAESGVA